MTTRVTVWNEFRLERKLNYTAAAEAYPEGIHKVLASALEGAGLVVKTATLDEPEHGLSTAVLEATDVLMWWGHHHHDEVGDSVVERVHRRVLDGMGLIVLHSAHHSRIFKRLLGTSGDLSYRIAGELERLWVVAPGHPIVEGLGEYLEIPEAEMYGEPFDIPRPDELVLISWFEGGDVCRSGVCWYRGQGRVFFFRPGHETYPIYHQPMVQRVIINACNWAAASSPGAPVRVQKRANPLNPIA